VRARICAVCRARFEPPRVRWCSDACLKAETRPGPGALRDMRLKRGLCLDCGTPADGFFRCEGCRDFLNLKRKLREADADGGAA
jgi:predicted nucleic acid-binding Zn ribbon protein